MFRAIPSLVLAAAAGALYAGNLQLDGHIAGDVHTRSLRVTLFSVERPYAESTDVDPRGDFHFHNLAPGNYTVAVVRPGLGEVRRTVVISSAVAGDSGVVHATIPYSSAEAAANPNGGTVSVQQASIPRHAAAKYAEAQRRLAGRDPEGAVRSLEEAVSIAPEYSAAWNALGVIAFQNGDGSRAQTFFRRSLEADPAAYEPLVNLGGVLLKAGSAADALEFNQRAVHDRPEDALANAQLGMNYFTLGRFEEAEPCLLAAKRLDRAHFSQPQVFLAEIYARRGNRRAAIRELEDVLEVRPDGPLSDSIRRNLAHLAQ
ncbi:MAG TPA: tetratricopeptide repeat protein [Bryobacteraceae bacterium]|nr:tetratricopeptide repeat protein [Bryobacteraceae bacterium]